MSMRIQKFLAAKAAGSKKGREIIKEMIGEHGEKLLDTLILFIEKFYGGGSDGKEKARKTEKYIIKIIAKVIVFIQNGTIKADAFAQLAQPQTVFCWQLIDQCELSMVLFNPSPLQGYILKATSTLDTIIRPHITGKTLDRLKSLQETFMDEKLITALLKDDKYRDYKGDISHSLIKILKELDVPRVDYDTITASTQNINLNIQSSSSKPK